MVRSGGSGSLQRGVVTGGGVAAGGGRYARGSYGRGFLPAAPRPLGLTALTDAALHLFNAAALKGRFGNRRSHCQETGQAYLWARAFGKANTVSRPLDVVEVRLALQERKHRLAVATNPPDREKDSNGLKLCVCNCCALSQDTHSKASKAKAHTARAGRVLRGRTYRSGTMPPARCAS